VHVTRGYRQAVEQKTGEPGSAGFCPAQGKKQPQLSFLFNFKLLNKK
jgi:hypothetical protein